MVLLVATVQQWVPQVLKRLTESQQTLPANDGLLHTGRAHSPGSHDNHINENPPLQPVTAMKKTAPNGGNRNHLIEFIDQHASTKPNKDDNSGEHMAVALVADACVPCVDHLDCKDPMSYCISKVPCKHKACHRIGKVVQRF